MIHYDSRYIQCPHCQAETLLHITHETGNSYNTQSWEQVSVETPGCEHYAGYDKGAPVWDDTIEAAQRADDRDRADANREQAEDET